MLDEVDDGAAEVRVEQSRRRHEEHSRSGPGRRAVVHHAPIVASAPRRSRPLHRVRVVIVCRSLGACRRRRRPANGTRPEKLGWARLPADRRLPAAAGGAVRGAVGRRHVPGRPRRGACCSTRSARPTRSRWPPGSRSSCCRTRWSGRSPGALLDRWDRRRVLLVANLVRAVLTLVVAVLVAAGVGRGAALPRGAGRRRGEPVRAGRALGGAAARRRAPPPRRGERRWPRRPAPGWPRSAARPRSGPVPSSGRGDAGAGLTTAVAATGSVLAAVLAAGFAARLLGPGPHRRARPDRRRRRPRPGRRRPGHRAHADGGGVVPRAGRAPALVRRDDAAHADALPARLHRHGRPARRDGRRRGGGGAGRGRAGRRGACSRRGWCTTSAAPGRCGSRCWSAAATQLALAAWLHPARGARRGVPARRRGAGGQAVRGRRRAERGRRRGARAGVRALRRGVQRLLRAGDRRRGAARPAGRARAVADRGDGGGVRRWACWPTTALRRRPAAA